MGGTIVVFDIGKTNLKLIAFDAANGAELWARSHANAPRLTGPYPHFDVEMLEAFLLDGLAHAAREAGGVLDGVIVTTHGASGALLTGERLAMPILDYEHDGPDETAEAYAVLRPAFAETLSPRLGAGLNLGAQLFWQQHRFADRFAAATGFVTYPQFWTFKLCGVAATEVTSLGCHTDLWSPELMRFSSLVARTNWQGLMAPTRRAGEVLGLMRPDLAQRLGLRTPSPIFCGIQDSNASLMPYLGTASPRSVVSSGTWAICFSLGGPGVQLDEARDTLANVDAFGNPVLSARFMGGREFDILTQGQRTLPSRLEIGRVLDAQVMALPGFVGGSGPFPHARGRWTVAPETLTPGERHAAASLYLALMTNVCLDLLSASGETLIQGPFTRNTLFCDALATLSARAVVSTDGATATAAGAARLVLPHLPASKGRPAAGLPPSLHASFRAYAEKWMSLAGKI